MCYDKHSNHVVQHWSIQLLANMSQDKSSSISDLRQRSTGLQDAPLPREKLPKDLQTLVDNEESLMDQIYDGT